MMGPGLCAGAADTMFVLDNELAVATLSGVGVGRGGTSLSLVL
jgi:hypothetical protein